jgi:hypothetical protein
LIRRVIRFVGLLSRIYARPGKLFQKTLLFLFLRLLVGAFMMPAVPSLLKSSDLISAHIQRGRLEAEGFGVAVVHENASNLWGGAVCGGPVLVAPAEEFPEIEEFVESAEPLDLPPEAFEDSGDEPPGGTIADPGLFGALLLGGFLGGALMVALALAANLGVFLDLIQFNPEWLSYGLPIPWEWFGWGKFFSALLGGALAGGLLHAVIMSLRFQLFRSIFAALMVVFMNVLFGVLLLLVFGIPAMIGSLLRTPAAPPPRHRP